MSTGLFGVLAVLLAVALACLIAIADIRCRAALERRRNARRAPFAQSSHVNVLDQEIAS